MEKQIRSMIRSFVAKNFLYQSGSDSLADDASFLERDLIDSTGVLELVAFLEETFPIKVEDRDVVPENLDSIDRLAAYVERKLPAGALESGVIHAR